MEACFASSYFSLPASSFTAFISAFSGRAVSSNTFAVIMTSSFSKRKSESTVVSTASPTSPVPSVNSAGSASAELSVNPSTKAASSADSPVWNSS